MIFVRLSLSKFLFMYKEKQIKAQTFCVCYFAVLWLKDGFSVTATSVCELVSQSLVLFVGLPKAIMKNRKVSLTEIDNCNLPGPVKCNTDSGVLEDIKFY